MQNYALALALAITQVQAALPGTDLASCQAFAATFDNTCSDFDTYDLASDAGEVVSCISRELSDGTLQSIHCPDGQDTTFTADAPCEWTRKLCVGCYENADGEVMVKVSSNGLPSHCINSIVNNPVAMEHDWIVRWQPAVEGTNNYEASDFASVTQATEILCDINRTQSTNMAASSQYELDPARRML